MRTIDGNRISDNIEPGASVLWIARHGNRQDFEDPAWFQSAARPYDPPLSKEGTNQARETGRRLVAERINRIWSSPFLRCMQTAQLIAQEVDLDFELEEGLSEWMNPEWFSATPELKNRDRLEQEFPRLKNDYHSAVPACFPESKKELFARVGSAVEHLVSWSAGTILLVGHGASVQGSVARLLGVDLSEKQELLPVIPCCSLVKLIREGDRWSLKLKGDTDHLSRITASRRFV